MLQNWTILLVSFGYLGVLFAIAYYGDRRAGEGRSIIANPYFYALSLAVYCTAWTFYGSVGRAAATGVGFLPIYIGPTLMAPLWWVVLRKIIRISKVHRITSIADFISSRYGKNTTLGGVATVIAVIGIIPYISLQLKGISTSYGVLSHYPAIAVPHDVGQVPVLQDTTFFIALLLAVFAVLFGTRHLEATERHEGLVAAVAFESIVKLVAFVAVGLFVTFGLYRGFGDIFDHAAAEPALRRLFTMGDETYAYSTWFFQTLLAMMAIMFLPRQFQVAVVENVDEDHLNKAIWLFPLYLLGINVFVLPIAFGGLLHFSGEAIDADTFVLALPMAEQREALALLVFIGGLSAATSMVIVATVALSTMICNDLVMPVLLRLRFLRLTERRDLSRLVLVIRRLGIVTVLLMGYGYFRIIGSQYTLVSIGLMSFAAVAQFAPAMLGGIFWKRGSRAGALCGLIAGFLVWTYTLPLPSLAQAGLLSPEFLDVGPFGISWLHPSHLFGLTAFDGVSHSLFWSMLANVACYVGVSLFSRQTVIEHGQAVSFVDVFRYTESVGKSIWRGTALVQDLQQLLRRFLGRERTDAALAEYGREHEINWNEALTADAELVYFAESLLAGAIGSASARVLVMSVVKEEPIRMSEVMDILDEARQVIAYSRALEQKSRALEEATTELKAANERLQELDRLKDDFVSTVTHELRTPLTSVRAFAEILHDEPDLATEQRQHFLSIIIKESERLTRLINQVLDFQRIESGTLEWHTGPVDLIEVVRDAAVAMSQLVREKGIDMRLELPAQVPRLEGDRDRLMQVLLNLLSNAVKFCDANEGRVTVRLYPDRHDGREALVVEVEDNGAGIGPEYQHLIFEKFRQVEHGAGRPPGSGLGLAITQRIVEHHGGTIRVKSEPGAGATFIVTLPLTPVPRPVPLASAGDGAVP